MPENQALTMPANSHSIKVQKLRNSCDSCNLAKLKCSRSRPSCTRCESQGVKCVYGVSLRAGKHRANGSNVQKPSPESPLSAKDSTKESTPIPTFSTAEISRTLEPAFSSILDSMPVNTDWSSFLAEDNPYLPSNSMDLNNKNISPQEQSWKPSIAQSHSDLSLNTFQFDPRYTFAARPQISPQPSRCRTFSGSTLLSEAQKSPLFQSNDACLCGRKILQQLLTLTATPDVPAAFDAALNQNKHIIALCHSILNHETHQHRDISFVLILTALIAKVIAVYETIYRSHHLTKGYCRRPAVKSTYFTDIGIGDGDSAESSEPNGINIEHHSTLASPRSLTGMTKPSLAPVPVRLTMGAYQLDEEDEERMILDILKLELSKVSALIKTFEHLFCGTGPDDQESKYESKAYEDLVYYLQKRLRVTLETPRD